MTKDTGLACALDAIDRANRQDPNMERVDGQTLPREYAYSLHMTRWLFALEAQPSERMQIACRAQHIERWTHSRADFPEGRKGITSGDRTVAASMASGLHKSWRSAVIPKRSASGLLPSSPSGNCVMTPIRSYWRT